MQLKFLGQTYSASSDRVKTIPAGETARFLGNSYQLRRSPRTFTSQQGARKYRGVAYGEQLNSFTWD